MDSNGELTLPFDLRAYKQDLRATYTTLRKKMTPEEKAEKDTAIFRNVLHMPLYTTASMVLCYVSMEEEIDSHGFINRCLADGKCVGVPYCIPGGREMDFYQIHSLDELEVRTYGVLEPIAETSKKLSDYSDSICILPGLSFDEHGYRIGYGGGYYDRFLSQKYDGKAKIGVCYNYALRPNLLHGRYDIPADYVVTEQRVTKRGFPQR